jgi:hypothetical protein
MVHHSGSHAPGFVLAMGRWPWLNAAAPFAAAHRATIKLAGTMLVDTASKSHQEVRGAFWQQDQTVKVQHM